MKYKVEHKQYCYPDENGYFGEFGGAFIDEKFNNFVRLIQSDFKDPALSEYAISFYSSYLIFIYPDTCPYVEASMLCALYGLALEYMQQAGEMSLVEKCALKGVDLNEAHKIMDELRESLEIIE